MNNSFRYRYAMGGVLLCALLACSAEAERNAGSENKREKTMPTTQAAPKHTNRLIHATSPYLLQHAHNPVDWYEWGQEAFDKAAKEDKPIFLSIGYSACHWCHVMAHESFEDEAIAAVLNEHFVCIKVDREERPDVDEIYMQATMGMNQGRGGWPMSVFLLPDRRPFFAGTYFPPQQFTALLTRVADVWKAERDKIAETGKQVQEYLARWAQGPDAADASISRDVVSKIANQLSDGFDTRYGGLDSAGNKFPPSMAMELMLREYARTGDSELLRNVERTLDQMARGGIYDHLGGGICRYSTDRRWLVPHFEKMLYDQGLVSGIYLDAYQVTRNRLYARTAADIFDYVIGDLQSAEGGFYSTRDADSEGMEGKYYIWTLEQVQEVLGQEDAGLFCAYYGVTKKGNWEERFGHAPPGPKNILNIQTPPDQFAKARGLSLAEFEQRLAAMRAKMLEARSKRVPPGLDDKIMTAWNGLMIASLAKGAAVLGEDKYAAAAAKAADFVLANLQKDGRLLRTYRGGRARLTAYLNDYAFMIEALLNLYEATSELKWLTEADRLNDVLIKHYFDAAGGGFFFTAGDAEQLIARSKNPRDGAIPSGNSVQALNLLRLAVLLDRKDYREKAKSIFRAFAPMATQSPGSFERLLCAVDFQLAPTREVVIVGSPDETGTRKLLATAYARYIPNKVVVLRPDGPVGDKAAERIPLLRDRSRIDGKPTAYVCENYACKLPVTTPADLAAQLESK